MSKTVLLAAAAAFSLTAVGASAAAPTAHMSGKYVRFHMPTKAKMLYNQNRNYASDAVNSQNYTSGMFSSLDNEAADDFVVPENTTWMVTEVDVSGQTSKRGGTPTSEDVTFYTDNNGVPGDAVEPGTLSVVGSYSHGNIAIKLPKNGVKLKSAARARTYWVSVAVNMSFESSGQWNWDVNGTQHGNQAQWENPAGGFGVCTGWGSIESCNESTGPDLMFDLRGSSETSTR
jgi:hypothetical protein